MSQQYHSWPYTQRKPQFKKIYAPKCSLHQCLQYPGYGNNLNVHWQRWMVYIHNGILLIHKKEWNNAIWSNANGPRDYHTKWSKSYRERQISYAMIHMRNLIKNNKNELIYKRETDSQISPMTTQGQTCWGRDKLGDWD